MCGFPDFLLLPALLSFWLKCRNVPFLPLSVAWLSSISLRTGLPVSSVLPAGKNRSMSSYATYFPCFARQYLVGDTGKRVLLLYDGWNTCTHGCIQCRAACKPAGAFTARSGRNLVHNGSARKSCMSLTGNSRLVQERLLLNPEIQSPSMGYPAAGTFCISIFPFAPTKSTSVSGCLLRMHWQ